MNRGHGPLVLRTSKLTVAQQTVRDGWLAIADGRVVGVGGPRQAPPDVPEVPVGSVIPGFVDTHVHGALGEDFARTDVAGARQIAAFHADAGTTSVVASIATGTQPDTVEAIRNLRPLVDAGVLRGIHLEGPYLAQGHRGAHAPQLLRDPDPAEVDEYLQIARGTLAMVTLAPERPGAVAVIDQLRRHNVAVAIGHTDANAQQTQTALEHGATVATHLWNGMPVLHHREPGPVGVLLGDERAVIELIVDGQHLDPISVELARRAAPGRIVLVSDAMGAAGLGDGSYTVAGSPVVVTSGVAMLADGTSLAGSTSTVADAFRRVRDAGWTLPEAVTATSEVARRIVGGPPALAVGSPADLLELDTDERQPVRVMRRGSWLASS